MSRTRRIKSDPPDWLTSERRRYWGIYTKYQKGGSIPRLVLNTLDFHFARHYKKFNREYGRSRSHQELSRAIVSKLYSDRMGRQWWGYCSKGIMSERASQTGPSEMVYGRGYQGI